MKLVPPHIEPSQNELILFFVMINLFFQFIKIPIKPKQQLFRIQKQHRLVNMLMCSPVPTFKMFDQLIILFLGIQMLLCFFVI